MRKASLRRLGGALALVGALASAGALPARAGAPIIAQQGGAPLKLGTSWYPEQWPESRWDADLSQMEAAHIGVVRLAEFAWSALEPREGEFDFGWLDRAIAAAHRHHMDVVLGTPTAGPPAWLTGRYPDVLRVDEDGSTAKHGNREHFSFASRRYRTFARRIAEQMAERYGHDPRVIGWQIDNEIWRFSFDPDAIAGWHAWLARKYGTVDALNDHWTTRYWSQTYDSFDQVPAQTTVGNPGLLLDWRRYATDVWSDYVANQTSAIRAHADPRQWITTNSHSYPHEANFDSYAIHRQLDMAAWDDYAPDGHYDWMLNSMQHDIVRGFKRADYWVMETQPGFANWAPVNRVLDKGQMREMAWQAVGHGADAVLYWQWRSALNGQEQDSGTLAGPDGKPVPAYQEAARIGAEFAAAGPALAGTTPHADVAVIQDYPSRWSLDLQRHGKDFDPIAELLAFYRPLKLQAQVVDVVGIDAPLAGYRLVVVPSLAVLTPEEAAHLADYVRGGGHLVLGPRTGMKDGYNALSVEREPGALAGLLGAHVEQYYALDDAAPVEGEAAGAHIWAETLDLDAPDAQAMLRWAPSNGWLDGQPAVVTRAVGKGRITYVGGWFDAPLLGKLAAGWLDQAGVAPRLAGLPEDVELGERSGGGRRIWVLVNHARQPRTVTLPAGWQDVLARTPANGPITLPPYGVALLSGH